MPIQQSVTLGVPNIHQPTLLRLSAEITLAPRRVEKLFVRNKSSPPPPPLHAWKRTVVRSVWWGVIAVDFPDPPDVCDGCGWPAPHLTWEMFWDHTRTVVRVMIYLHRCWRILISIMKAGGVSGCFGSANCRQMCWGYFGKIFLLDSMLSR